MHTRYIYCPTPLYRSPEESSEMCENELDLLEYCLKVNPKAYSIWFHRQWVMTHGPSPNWPKEKTLCDLFLRYDERNCERACVCQAGGGLCQGRC